MEAIITIVGFLGAGKTTLLKHLTKSYLEQDWQPYVILNDYENANLDAGQFLELLDPKSMMALSGSCICCSGIQELRYYVNTIPKRDKGVTLIEANGTSDACSLNGFLGVGLDEHFLPPVQVSVVDVKNWQKRGEHNELEANQIQISSLIVLSHVDGTSPERLAEVKTHIAELNPSAQLMHMEDIDVALLPKLLPSQNEAQKLDHLKAHWSSCSIDLPTLPNQDCVYEICNTLPKSIQRVKGCTKVGTDEHYTYFERTPDGYLHRRQFSGVPHTGPKLLAVGPGSGVSLLKKVVNDCIEEQTAKQA